MVEVNAATRTLLHSIRKFEDSEPAGSPDAGGSQVRLVSCPFTVTVSQIFTEMHVFQNPPLCWNRELQHLELLSLELILTVEVSRESVA